MMGTPVRAVDHGIGGAGQFIVQTLVDQPSGDRLLRRRGHDGVAVERSVLAALLERRADRADDVAARAQFAEFRLRALGDSPRSEEHTSELQSLMRISYAVF